MRQGMPRFALIGAIAAASMLGGCGGSSVRGPGSFDADDTSTSQRLANLLAFNKKTEPELPPKPADKVNCPEIMVLDGTAAQRVYANGNEGSNAGLRYQFSIGDVARECAVQNGQIALKVGVEGKVLLGPAGSPGSFSPPVRIVVVRESDQQPVVSKLYKASVSIPTGQTVAGFTVVSEPLYVPFTKEHAEDDYTIKVGFDSGPEKEKPAPRQRKRS
jgi:hypothetical protein